MSSNQRRKLFICGLNYHTTDKTLRAYFSKFGKISRCSIERNAAGKSRGFGYIFYEESSSIDDCIRVGSHTLDGNDLNIKVLRIKEKKEELPSSTNDQPSSANGESSSTNGQTSSTNGQPSSTNGQPSSTGAYPQLCVSDAQAADKKIFVGGLRQGIDEKSLHKYFSQYVKINEVLIMKHKNGKPRGFGFVIFEDTCAITAVLEKPHTINNRMLCVRKAIPKEKMIQQQQDFENNQYYSPTEKHENIHQSSSRNIGPVRHSRNGHHPAASRKNHNRFTPYDKRISIAGGQYPTQINIYLN